MAIDQNLAKCLEVDLSAFDISVLNAILSGFSVFLAKLKSVPELILIIPDLGDLPGLILGDFAAEVPLPLGTLEIPQPPDFDVPVFDPAFLIEFLAGLGTVALKMPELFGLSLELSELVTVPPPVPQIPTFDAFVSLLALSLGLPTPGMDFEFSGKFARCLATALIQESGIPIPIPE